MGLLADRVAYIGCPRDPAPQPLLLLSNQGPIILNPSPFLGGY